MAQATAAHLLSDRQVAVETPEHVAIGYELADLGSRFTALLLDWLLIILGSLGLWIGMASLSSLLGLNLVTGVALGITIFVGFLLQWGYFMLFEGLRDGQTPGKRWMGIRVVHDGGFPVTMRGSAVRNLLRIIDSLPPPSWAVGGIVHDAAPADQARGRPDRGHRRGARPHGAAHPGRDRPRRRPRRWARRA